MKNEFDKNLTDKGWQAMRHLLDREMPEQRRRRRFAWWLGTLLLLPLAGAGGWWLFGESKPEKTAPPVEKSKIFEPVARAESESTFPKVSNFQKVEPIPAVVAVPANKHADRVISNEVRNLKESLLQVSPLYDTVFNLLDKSQDLTNFEGLSNFAPLPVAPQFVENEIKNTPKLSTVTPFEPAITKKHTEPKHWSFGLAAGLASENFSALNGFSAGGAVNWQFARKWGLRSGLQFAQYSLSQKERPVISLSADAYEDATGNNVDNLNTGGNPTTPASSASSPVYVPIERLQQLEMPLLTYWQPVRPLRVFGGISTAYTLSARASSQSFANNQFYLAADEKAQDNLNDLTSKTLSRWQASWQVGAGVRIGRHFELDAFYKHGIANTKNNADAQGLFDPTMPAGLSGQANSDFKNRYFLLQGIWFF